MKKVVSKYPPLQHIRLRWVYLFLLGIYMVDFLTTIIALCFFDGVFIEANPLQAQLFNLGLYGWFISLFLTFSILFIVTICIGLGGLHILKLEKEKKTIGYYNLYLGFLCGIFFGFELLVIINNVGLLLGLI